MKKPVVKNIFFLMESFNTREFNAEIIYHYPDSIIVNFSYHDYCIVYTPEGVNIKSKRPSYIKEVNYYSSIFLVLLNLTRMFFVGLRLSFRFRPEVIVAESYFISFLTGFLKYIKLCRKTIYISGDWFVGNKRKSKLLSHIANEHIFPVIDYFSCKLNDSVFNLSEQISNKRYNYWKRKITKIEKTIYFPLSIKSKTKEINSTSKKICFIGLLKDDCGIDIAIKSLKILRSWCEFSLIIIGPYANEYKSFKKLTAEIGVTDYVDFLGFVERDRFSDILSGCFCGINILKTEASYTSHTIPAKIVDYIQHLLPIIATENIGFTANQITKNNLGIIIKPEEEELIAALLKIDKERTTYGMNIIKYLEQYKKTPIKEIVEV